MYNIYLFYMVFEVSKNVIVKLIVCEWAMNISEFLCSCAIQMDALLLLLLINILSQ